MQRIILAAMYATFGVALLALTQCEGPTATIAKRPIEPLHAGLHTDFREAFVAVAKNTVPSVVSVVSERSVPAARTRDFFDFFFGAPGPLAPRSRVGGSRERGVGSGFVIRDDGYILTNAHVVEHAQKLRVDLAGREVPAQLVGLDSESDLAVVRIQDQPVQALPLGDSDALQIGEWVVAVGASFGLEQSVTSGIVSAKGRQHTGIATYGNFLQTDAAINPGNSGGPLIDLEGRVVGINTAIFSQSGGYEGVGFAIPINLAKKVSKELIAKGHVTRGWLGVSVQELTPELQRALGIAEQRGVLVADVIPKQPAELAGIRRGDVMTAIRGTPVASGEELMNLISGLTPDESVQVRVLRDRKPLTLRATVAARQPQETPEEPAREPSRDAEGYIAALGVTLARTSAREDGLFVLAVDLRGPAAEAGLRVGDCIREVNRQTVGSPADVRRAVGEDSATALLWVRHGGGITTYLALQLSPTSERGS